MTNPEFKQFFEQFRGKDASSSPLGRGLDYAIEFKNMEKLHNGSLRGRQGLNLASQPLHVMSIAPYIYVDEYQVTQNELLGIASFEAQNNIKYFSLVKLVDSFITVTYSGGGTWAYSVTKTTSGVVFTLLEDGVSVLTSNLGEGYNNPLDDSFQDLADDINAITNFACTLNNTAVVNGAQTNVTTITVDSGHSFTAGDMTYFRDRQSGNPSERIAEILSTTATTITINTDTLYTDVDVNDNDIIGEGNFPAAILDLVTSATLSASSENLSFTCWQPVRTSRDGNYLGWWSSDENKTLPSFSNNRNCLYFTAPYFAELDYKVDVPDIGKLFYKAGLYKYDGKAFYLSGMLPRVTSAGVSAAGSGTGVDAGTHKYGFSYKRIDSQNNEIEWFAPETTEVTLASAEDVNIIKSGLDTYRSYFNLKSAKLTAGTTASNTLTITSGHRLRTGDYVYFKDTTDGLITRKVTSFTATTIVIDGDVVTVANGARVSNTAFRVWRSKANTESLFLALEDAAHFTMASETFVDSTADNDLGITQLSVKPENIQFPFPRGKAVTSHQDSLCLSSAQTVYWEDADAPESSPLALTNTNIPTGITGDIECLVSNIDSSLYALKPSAQYELNGSVQANQIEINKILENNYGVSNSSAARIIDDILMGVGDLGIWASSVGKLAKGFGAEFLIYFRNKGIFTEGVLKTNRATISYDPIKNWVHVFLPVEKESANLSLESYYTTTSDSKHLVFMISEDPEQPSCWVEFTYDIKQMGNAGFATINNTFYQQSSLYLGSSFSWATNDYMGFLHKRPDTEDAEDFLDHTKTYDWEIQTAWDDAGEPKTYKFFKDFVLFQLQPQYFIAAFTVAFTSFRDWVSGSSKEDTSRSTSLTFSTSSDTEKSLQFDKQYKAQRRSFKLSGTINKNPPLLSGYEYTVDERAYGKDKVVP